MALVFNYILFYIYIYIRSLKTAGRSIEVRGMVMPQIFHIVELVYIEAVFKLSLDVFLCFRFLLFYLLVDLEWHLIVTYRFLLLDGSIILLDLRLVILFCALQYRIFMSIILISIITLLDLHFFLLNNRTRLIRYFGPPSSLWCLID